MSYADYVIKRTNRLVDDEFEQAMLHKSSTVALAYNDWFCIVLGVIFAWVLPGAYSLLACIILLIPLTLPRLIGVYWMRRTVPIPRYSTQSPPEFILSVLLMVCMGVGIFHNIGWPSDPFAFTPFIGGLGGAYYGYKRSEKRREEDRKRLDKELDSESQ
ncbi:hypothetical protein [Corynebacterium lowii]|uniref:Uncharacterized protein n=1 Tax=Corynebacterium lowii TaxID=1544413 RepID=A0A0Q0Z9J8_9CORY|nr:hypothetical protein [Corynebacterium lowii]KQB86295.1 hypothetical protein Clow_01214 [Corynebacterium lowii]MDP9850780.1 hypothetical protein [Corynebacterium lowii]